MSRIKNGKFKTIQEPYDYEKDNNVDRSASINVSTHLGNLLIKLVNANILLSLFNSLFCCCFSPSPTYYLRDEIADNPTAHIRSINFIKDTKMTKNQLLEQNHGINSTSLYIIRLIVFFMIFIVFYFYPQLLVIIYYIFNITKIFILDHLLLFDLFTTTVIVLAIIILSKLNNLTSSLIVLFIVISFIILIIYLIIAKLTIII